MKRLMRLTTGVMAIAGLAWLYDAHEEDLAWTWTAPPFSREHGRLTIRTQGVDEADEGDERQMPVAAGRLFAPRWRMKNGPQVRAAFREVVKDANLATVCIHCDGEHVAYGGVIDAAGWIVTKASQLKGDVVCVLPDGRRELEAHVAGVDKELDLALLKVEADHLPTLDLSSSSTPEVGDWLATTGETRDPVAVGVVSVGPRAIPHQAGILGVQLGEQQLPVVRLVFPRSGAAKAGLVVNDQISQINGRAVSTRAEAIELIRSHNPGDEISLAIVRDGTAMTVKAQLSGTIPEPMRGRSDFQNHMGGRLSERRLGFPSALQHDTVLRPIDCGGPVVDLDGKVVGFNIARAGRTESFALRASDVRQAAAKLMAASLAASAAK